MFVVQNVSGCGRYRFADFVNGLIENRGSINHVLARSERYKKYGGFPERKPPYVAEREGFEPSCFIDICLYLGIYFFHEEFRED